VAAVVGLDINLALAVVQVVFDVQLIIQVAQVDLLM